MIIILFGLSALMRRRSEEHTSVLQPRREISCVVFCFNDTATTEIYTLSLHDALPISVLTIGCDRATYCQNDNYSVWIIGAYEKEIGRAHVCTPATTGDFVCRLLF